ncbi:hypothetical protein [Herbidospora daliensis]|uniref:hypothetical protein n=1 Tax=Herbidospora daliensis TaxID=295585 RepID=UPI000781F836|nr:hypothetical protein [Herbidospora daliensis]
MRLRGARNRVRRWFGLRPIHGDLIELALEYRAQAGADGGDDARPYLRAAMIRWLPEFEPDIEQAEREHHFVDPDDPLSYRDFLQILWDRLWPAIENRDAATLSRLSELILEIAAENPDADRTYLRGLVEEMILESLGFYYAEIDDRLPEPLRAAAERFHGPNRYSPAADPNGALFPSRE